MYSQKHLTSRRRIWIALGVFFALLLIFHRPVLLAIAERVARHYATGEHLKLALRLEGSLFTNLTVRNFHAVATGPSIVESIDIDYGHFDYSLFRFLRHGFSNGFRNVELRGARIILNPDKRPKELHPPEKDELPSFFPDRLRLTDVTLIIRDHPHDFVAEHLDAYLDPTATHDARLARLQFSPGQTWSNVSAHTSYSNRNLVVRDLFLDQDQIRLVNIDASHIEAKTLPINLDATVGGGKVTAKAIWNETATSLKTELHASAEGVDAAALNKYATLTEGFLAGKVENFKIDGSGILDTPDSWVGTVSAELDAFRAHEMGFDRGVVRLTARNGKAVLESAEIKQGENKFHLRGQGELPHNMRDFGSSPATIEVIGSAVDLERATAGMPQKLSGAAQVNGRIEIKNGRLDAEMNATADKVGFADGSVEKVSGRFTASRLMTSAPGKEEPWFRHLQTAVTFEVSNVQFKDYAIDTVQGSLSSKDDLVALEKFVIQRKQNEITLHGEYRLPPEVGKADRQPARVGISINASELGDYWRENAADRISGPLQGNGQIEWKQGKASGQLSLYGAGLRSRNLVLRQISSQCSIADNVIYLNDFTAALNGNDFVSASGKIDLKASQRYDGKIAAQIADLSVLRPLLKAANNDSELAGSFVLDWQGNGEAKTFKNSGTFRMNLQKGRYGKMQSLQARVEAAYSPDELEIPIIFLQSDRMDFQAIAHAKGETFEVSKIQLDQGQAKYAQGFISLPFVWKNLGTSAPVIPASGKVTVNFQSENIELKKLFEDFGMKAIGSGALNVRVDAGGTLDRLDGHVQVSARDLRSDYVPKLEPATFELTADAKNEQLVIHGSLKQAKIQPVDLTASMPFDAVQILREKKLSDNTPVTAKVRMPRSSVNFIRQFVPDVQQIDGDLGLDVVVAGTIGKPSLSGSGDITINVARANNVTFPALTNFKARLNFQNSELKLEQFGGDLSGGKFTVTGGVSFPKLTEPQINLQIRADSALVARNDTATVRVDADVKIAGPLNAANVTGTVATTDSHVLKNIDLIPIGLPGRPAPEPSSDRPDLSFPVPPVRDWIFDVAIKTKNPFRIRGNLAEGGAIVDLHLRGTGLHPTLDGLVRMENVEATLPFSRLEIGYGFLYFQPSDPLNPKIDLHGTSVIRDYTIHVFIYGTTISPEAVFTSEPPLPQEEIISLLATGTTREELTGNNNVLASRAATLLVQQLYRKVFKKSGEAQSTSVFDRLDLDVGQIDPRTGQREASARFKVNNQVVLMGDLGVTGSFKGMVKYLIRFH